MEATHTASSRTRPSASTGGTGLGALFFGLSAGPVAWYIQLVINYALASHTCFPDGSPLDRPPAGWLGINLTLFAINIAAIVLALAASLVSLRIWVAVRHDYPAPHSDILAPAIGRITVSRIDRCDGWAWLGGGNGIYAGRPGDGAAMRRLTFIAVVLLLAPHPMRSEPAKEPDSRRRFSARRRADRRSRLRLVPRNSRGRWRRRPRRSAPR